MVTAMVSRNLSLSRAAGHVDGTPCQNLLSPPFIFLLCVFLVVLTQAFALLILLLIRWYGICVAFVGFVDLWGREIIFWWGSWVGIWQTYHLS